LGDQSNENITIYYLKFSHNFKCNGVVCCEISTY